jgi:hypothetical protein
MSKMRPVKNIARKIQDITEKGVGWNANAGFSTETDCTAPEASGTIFSTLATVYWGPVT